MGVTTKTTVTVLAAVVVLIGFAPAASAQRPTGGAVGTEDGVVVGVGDRGTGRRATTSRGARPMTCRFFVVGPPTPETPQGTMGLEVHQPSKLPLGTPLWRACFYQRNNRVADPARIWLTGTNPLDRTVLDQVSVLAPTLATSPPGATLVGVPTRLGIGHQPDQTISATLDGVTYQANVALSSVSFTVVGSTDGTPSRDDGVVISCSAEQVRAAASTARVGTANTPWRVAVGSGCTHRFAGPSRTVILRTTTTWRRWSQASDGTTEDLGVLEQSSDTELRVDTASTRLIGAGR